MSGWIRLNGEGEQIAETLRIYGSSTAQNTTLNLVHVQDIDFSNPVTINDFIFSTTDQYRRRRYCANDCFERGRRHGGGRRCRDAPLR